MFNKKLMKTIGFGLFLFTICFGIISCTYAADVGNDTNTTNQTNLKSNVTIDPKTIGGLKEAINSVKINGTVYLKNGVYTGTNNTGITINKSINIVGLGSKVTIDAQGKRQIFIISNGDVTLKKLKLINGNANGLNKLGGAIYCKKGSLTVSNCIFTANKANIGGAIYADKFSLIVNNCTFTKNQAKSGGAIACYEKTTINKSTFKNNKATVEGGAIDSIESTINNSVFTSNQAKNGGAICSLQSTIFKCTFNSNQGTYGGAIFDGRDSTVNNCKFTSNKAKENGGAIYENGWSLDENNSTVNNSFKVNNSTFTKNQAKNGGALYSKGNISIEKCTFEKNKATQKGGAIYNLAKPLKIIDSKLKSNIAGKKYNAIYSKNTISKKNVTITPKDGTKVKK